MKRVLFLLFLMLSIPLVQAGTFEEWVQTQPPLVVEEGEIPAQTAQQCIAKAEQSNELLDALDNGLYDAFVEVTNLMSLVCQINGLIDVALDLLNFFAGCICVLEAFGGGAACKSVETLTESWKIAGIPVSQMCCYFTNGLCGIATCADTSKPSSTESNNNNQKNAAGASSASNTGSSGGENSEGGVFQDITSGKYAGLAAGISPYDNVFLAAACQSPGAMVHHLNNLKTIYKVQECCVREACTNELSPAICDDSFQENICTYFEGSFLGSLVGWLAYQATYQIVSWILEEVAETIVVCIAVFVDIIEVPDMVKGVLTTIDNIGEGSDVSCSDLGFNFKAINDQKKVKSDSSVIDEADQIQVALDRNSYVVDNGYNVRFERDYTSRAASSSEVTNIRNSLTALGYDGEKFNSKRLVVYENPAGNQIVRVDNFLGGVDPKPTYLVSSNGKVSSEMKEANIQDVINQATITSAKYNIVDQSSFVIGESIEPIKSGQIVILPDGTQVDTSEMRPSNGGFSLASNGAILESVRVQGNTITHVKNGVSTTYSEYGKVVSSNGQSTITSGGVSLANVPSNEADIKLKALYYGIPSDVVQNARVERESINSEVYVALVAEKLSYVENTQTVVLTTEANAGFSSPRIPVESYRYFSEASGGDVDFTALSWDQSSLTTTLKVSDQRTISIQEKGDYSIIKDSSSGTPTKNTLLLSNGNSLEGVSDSVVAQFENGNPTQQYLALSNFGNQISEVKVNSNGQFYVEGDSRVAYVDSSNTVVYSYARQERPSGITNVLANPRPVYYTEFSSPDGSKSTLRRADNEMSLVTVNNEGSVSAIVTTPVSFNSFSDFFDSIRNLERNPEREAELKAAKEAELAKEKEEKTARVVNNPFGPQFNFEGLVEFGLSQSEVSISKLSIKARASVSDYAAKSIAGIASGFVENAICEEEASSSVPRTQEPSDNAISGSEYCDVPYTTLTGKILKRTPIVNGYMHDYEYTIAACREDIYYRVSLGTCQSGCELEDISEGRLDKVSPPIIQKGSINTTQLKNWLCFETTDETLESPYCVPFELDPTTIQIPEPIELPYACPVGYAGPSCLKVPPSSSEVDVCAVSDSVALEFHSDATPARDNKIQYSYYYEVSNCLETPAGLEITLFGEGIEHTLERRSGNRLIGVNETVDDSGRALLAEEYERICLSVEGEEVCKSFN